MTHEESAYQANIEELKKHDLLFKWVVEDLLYVDVSIEHVSGWVIMADTIFKHRLNVWLGENIGEAIRLYNDRDKNFQVVL